MAMLNTLARAATKPLPRVVSPKARSIVDYVTAGSFFATAGWFWSRNKRASVAALICGGAQLAVSALTDYPGGAKRAVSLRARREIDFGLAAMTATMPHFLAFKDEPERKFFLAEGVLMTVVSELTQFPGRPQRVERGRKNAKIA